MSNLIPAPTLSETRGAHARTPGEAARYARFEYGPGSEAWIEALPRAEARRSRARGSHDHRGAVARRIAERVVLLFLPSPARRRAPIPSRAGETSCADGAR